jgi:ubiquinone/menaquinone biosynthesis C-methylase UbiE
LKYDGSNYTRIPQSKIVYLGLAWVLGSPLRRFTMNANRVLARMGVREGLAILEVGCGPGFFTLPAARMAGNGTIYALDVHPMMTEDVEKKIRKYRLQNVKSINSPASRTGLQDESIDLILCIDVLSDISDLHASLREMHRVLKAAGTLSVYEPHTGWEPGAWKPETTTRELTSTGLFFPNGSDGRILKFGKTPK